jgi:hypothetical protein
MIEINSLRLYNLIKSLLLKTKSRGEISKSLTILMWQILQMSGDHRKSK